MQQKLKQKAKTSIYKGRYKQRNKNLKNKKYLDKQKYGQTNKNMDKQIKIQPNTQKYKQTKKMWTNKPNKLTVMIDISYISNMQLELE